MPQMSRKFNALILLIFIVFFSSCNPSGSDEASQAGSEEFSQQTDQVVETRLPTETAFPTATSAPPRSLVVCLGQEPSNLYLYGGVSESAWSVLEAIYDGPVDYLSYEPNPVILDGFPDFGNGNAYYQPVSIRKGDLVLNLEGDLAALEAGMRLMPSGCLDSSCAIDWDGSTELQMDQLVMKFKLLEGITWSDGTPLLAGDSVYSFRLAADEQTPISKNLVYRTASYTALDDLTVEWVGIPGFIPERFDSLFWIPLPEHVLGQYSAQDLLSLEISALYPLGWGPYKIEEWVIGDHIQLVKNPNYFRAGEGLPEFDVLVYRFLDKAADNDLAALLSGECDLVDQTTLLDEQLDLVLELEQSGKLVSFVEQSSEWAQIDFGIRHVSLDDGYYYFAGDRPDYFSDERVRQAFAYCIDRQAIVDQLLYGFSSVPNTYLHPENPMYDAGIETLGYDTAAGRQLLDQAGWKDWDGNPDTPLQAVGILNVPDGTFFSLDYYTTEAELRVQVAMQVAANLADCGVQLNVHYLSPEELFAPGPDGIIFGRQFDLVQFSWKSGSLPACQFYETEQIPNLENNWLKINVSGYSNPDFDAACELARTARPDYQENYEQRQKDVLNLFAQELPVLPLYYRLKVAVGRPDLCGAQMDVTARSLLWGLEKINYGQGCP